MSEEKKTRKLLQQLGVRHSVSQDGCQWHKSRIMLLVERSEENIYNGFIFSFLFSA